MYGYLSLELLSDSFRDLKLRTAAGIGGGWNAIREADLSLRLEAGLAQVYEDFSLTR